MARTSPHRSKKQKEANGHRERNNFACRTDDEMDSGLDSSLAVINNHYYARYQVPRFARIPRKPVSPSLYSADVTFSDEADDEITELRNPLGRIARVMNAQASGPRPSTATATCAGRTAGHSRRPT